MSRNRQYLSLPPRRQGPDGQPTAADLRASVDGPTLHRILRALDPADRSDERRAPERLAELLSDRGRLAAGLDRLPGAGLVLLELLTEIPDRAIPLEVARREAERRIGRPEAGAEAEAQLAAHSLLLKFVDFTGKQGQVVLPGTLAHPIRPLVRGLALRTVDPGAVTITRAAVSQDALRLAAAVLSGALRRDPPKVTQQARLFAKAREQLAKVYFPGDTPPGARLDQALRLAERCGAVTLVPEEVRTERSAWEAEARRTAADPWAGAIARVVDALTFDLRPGLRDAVARLRDGFLPVALLRSAMAVQRHALLGFGQPGYYSTALVAQTDARIDAEVERLRTLPVLALGQTAAGEEVLGLPAPVPAGPTGRSYVQPNLELLLPPGTDPLVAFDAARIAEVRRVESVALLSLTSRSIRQARQDDLSAEDIQAILERVAPGAVPENVRITVAGWASGPTPARLLSGGVLHCPDLAAAERLRRAGTLPPGLRELAPGVWLLPSSALAATHQALQAAKIDVRPRVELVGQGSVAPDRLRFTEPGWAEDDAWEDEQDFDEDGLEDPTEAKDGQPSPLDPMPGPDPALLARVAAARLSPPPAPPEPPRILTPPAWTRVDDAGMVSASGLLLEAVTRLRARTGQPFEIEVRHGEGTVVRYPVRVERCAERRGLKFLEGRRLDTEEDVSVPFGQIWRVQLSDAEREVVLDPLGLAGLAPARRDQPKVGRNDPCPCGSGRKYKKCCGQGG